MSDFDDTLRRYVAIQRQAKQLEEEKQALRDRLVLHMSQQRRTWWKTQMDGTDINVKCTPITEVTYNELLLRERLGDRYVEILDVDLKKMKDHLPEAQPLLAPLLNLVGTPSREKVRDAIERGRIEPRLFDGAYTKTETHRFAVSSSRNK